jgi:hypothetical protein
MFLAEFRKEHLGQRLVPDREPSHVQQVTCIGTDCRKQPAALTIHSDYGLAYRNVIPKSSLSWL